MISNKYQENDSCILYQTIKKTELVSYNNSSRLIELLGKETYVNHLKELTSMITKIEFEKRTIVDILKNKIENEGIGGLIRIINKICH